MKKKIYCLLIATQITCGTYGISDIDVKRNQTIRFICPAPYSVQNFVDLYGPFTMATANNGQILDFSRDRITSLYGLQNITNYDVVAVRLIGNCIVGNTVDESFPDTPFQGLPNTIEIRLAQNQIESLPATFLSGLDQLAYITLGNNQLTSFPENFFSGHDLLYLGIANNYFSSLDTVDISNMPSLLSFAVNNNNITSIPADYFQNNILLISIDLNTNSLTDWPDTLLNSNSYIEYLNLSYNALSDFQPDYITENSTVLLIGNPITPSTQDAIQSKYPEVNFIFL